MARYKKKPVIIEAFKWYPNSSPEECPSWFFNACQSNVVCPEFDGSCTIKTLEGNHRCEIGDYIIQGVAGELYPCKPDIFEMTYEFVE